MSIVERGRAIVDYLNAKGLGKSRPIVFIVHSLGGLLIKAALRKSSDMAGGNGSSLIESTAGVVFLATPHTGSSFASAAKLINAYFKLKFSKMTLELERDSLFLDEFNDWYKSNAVSNGVKTAAYYEMVKYLNKAQIVTKQSANPNVHDCFPIPVNSNHTDICKFDDKDNSIFVSIVSFVRDCIGNCHTIETSDIDDFYINKKSGDRLSLYSKLENGNMTDEYEIASMLSEQIEKKLKKYDLLCSARREQTSFVKEVFNSFDMFVKPLIDAGASKIEINESIYDKIVKPIVDRERKFFGDKATISEVRETIYFLTGNCHIKWSSD
jgi:hypothetical protein